MSEIKKVPLVSFASSKTKDKEVENVAKTFRISLDLTRTDEDTCPMFNYKEELTTAKRREKLSKNGIEKGLQKNGLDPFMDENDDDDVRRIAIEMEAKYGVSVAPKKKRKGRKDDYADIGMGYDESDSFIDNTDGYDEMIPQNVTTLHGGFYINCGALEFKTDDEASSNVSSSSSSDDSSDNEDNAKKRSRKRKFSDSDDDDSQKSKTDKAPPHKKPKLANGQQKIKKKFLTPDKIKPKKKRILPPASGIPLMNTNRLAVIAEEAPTATNKLTADDETDSKLNKDKDDLVYKKPMSLDNITDIINSVAKGRHNNSLVNNLFNFSTSIANAADIDIAFDIDNPTIDLDDNDAPAFDSVATNMQIDEKDSLVEAMETNEEEVVLPGNLPNDILCVIDSIKQAATVNIANNTSVFSSQVNNLILSFERKCKCLGKQSRSKIYAYLAAFTNCKKEALVRRAKNLVLQDDDTKLMQNIDLLRKKIEEVMPAIKENYEQMRKHVEIRKMSSEDDLKSLRMPKKTFPWTEEIKKWVRDIYSLRRKHFMNQGIVKETVDAQLEMYFKTEIQILWPDNWISSHYLMKVAKNEKKIEKPTTPSANTKPQIKQNTENKETTPSNIQNLNGNSVIRTTTSEIIKKIVNSDKQLVINLDTPVNKTKVKTLDKPVSVTIPTLPDKPHLPQVSITQISPTVIEKTFQSKQPVQEKQSAIVECEILDISSSNTPSQVTAKPADRIKTISEILKMQQLKKKEQALGNRSNSPSLTSVSGCQIIDLTSEAKAVEVNKKRPGPKCSKIEVTGNHEETRPKPSTTSQPPLVVSQPNSATPLSVITQPQQHKPNPQDTAEIQKVMEDLKALQQMTYSPSSSSQPKPNLQEQQNSASNQSQQPAVSVIALNKNYASSSNATNSSNAKVVSQKSVEGKAGLGSGESSFQEAFQRQFMASLQQQQPVSVGKSKSNSQDKVAHSSSSSGLLSQNTVNTTSNNNYESNSSGSVKTNSYPSQTQSQKPKQPSQK